MIWLYSCAFHEKKIPGNQDGRCCSTRWFMNIHNRKSGCGIQIGNRSTDVLSIGPQWLTVWPLFFTSYAKGSSSERTSYLYIIVAMIEKLLTAYIKNDIYCIIISHQLRLDSILSVLFSRRLRARRHTSRSCTCWYWMTSCGKKYCWYRYLYFRNILL